VQCYLQGYDADKAEEIRQAALKAVIAQQPPTDMRRVRQTRKKTPPAAPPAAPQSAKSKVFFSHSYTVNLFLYNMTNYLFLCQFL
jgi:hypothetical protein